VVLKSRVCLRSPRPGQIEHHCHFVKLETMLLRPKRLHGALAPVALVMILYYKRT
jgi:hypothetical protein